MKKVITIPGFIHIVKEHYSVEPSYYFSECNLTGRQCFENYVMVQPHTIEVEIPADFDPRPELLKGLDKKEQELKAEFARQMMEIGKERSKLLAITNEVNHE